VTRRTVDVTLDNLASAPTEVLEALFWEFAVDAAVEPRFEKEEWFSSTLLEWGSCGKLLLDIAKDPEQAVAFAQYAPASLFPRVATFPSGKVSSDAVYLSYCYVVEGSRGEGLGTHLVRIVAREIADRGYRAVEALGDLAWDGSWILPAPFLAANGFAVLHEDPRYPLMRLDLRTALEPDAGGEAAEAAEVAGPHPGPDVTLPWSAPAPGVA
jgi:GNAT superfamily N-acetyltransferase